MTYTDAEDLDFALIERNAYQRGDMVVAQLAAVADDAKAEIEQANTEHEKELERESERAEKAEEGLADLQSAVQERLQAVDTILAECKRISKRAELEAALQAVYDATT